jgi:hypothetical protein
MSLDRSTIGATFYTASDRRRQSLTCVRVDPEVGASSCRSCRVGWSFVAAGALLHPQGSYQRVAHSTDPRILNSLLILLPPRHQAGRSDEGAALNEDEPAYLSECSLGGASVTGSSVLETAIRL